MTLISADDHIRISQAIHDAESTTSGEIYAVLARRSDDYFFVSGFVVTCGILIAAIVVAIAAHWYWYDIALPVFGLALLAAFVSANLLLWFFPTLRLMLVPRTIRYRRSHLNAIQQFLSRNVHVTTERTGILLFVSLAEHYAEVVADSGINSRVSQQEWNDIVALLIDHAARGQLVDGFVAAISKSGEMLTTHFPVRSDDTNELEDRLIEL